MEFEFIALVEQMSRQEQAFAQLYSDLAKSFGLSECAMWILYILDLADGEVSQSDISDRLMFPKQTVHSAVQKMVKEGLLSLTVIPHTKNRKRVEFTKKGQAFADQTVVTLKQAESLALSQMGKEKMNQYVTFQGEYLAEMTKVFQKQGLLEEKDGED